MQSRRTRLDSFQDATGLLGGGLVLYLTTSGHEPAVAIVPRAEKDGVGLFVRRAW